LTKRTFSGSQEISHAIGEVEQAATTSLEQTGHGQEEANELAALPEQLWQLLKTYHQEDVDR
jgi:hypothetical protein